MWGTLEVVLDPDQSLANLPYAFPAIMWQGIHRHHFDHVVHQFFPTLTSALSCRMITYFDKHQTILSLMAGIPAFLASDQFLGYSLCSPGKGMVHSVGF